jgi:hypothetical protein
MEPKDNAICSHAGPAEAWGWRASAALKQDKQQRHLDQSANIACSPAYNCLLMTSTGRSTKTSGRGDSQSRHRLILDGLVDGSRHIASDLLDSFPGLAALLGRVVGKLFDVLGDVSRLIGRLVSQPTELVGILVDVRGGPTAI